MTDTLDPVDAPGDDDAGAPAGYGAAPRGPRRGGRRSTRRVSRYEYVVLGGLALTLATSALGLGAVHTVVLIPVAFVALATALAAQKLGRRTVGARWPAPALICLALAAYTVLQCVPMPLSLLDHLAPANADVWRHSLDPLERTRSFAPISLDPGATLREALRWLLYGATFFSARTLARLRGSGTGVALVFGVAALLAAVTLGHELAQATRVYGFYQPRFPVPSSHMGPLLNSNNLAGYLNLGALCGTGLLLSRNVVIPRYLSWVGLALVGALALRAASRAGVAALLVGLLLLGAVVLGKTIRREEKGLRRLAAPALLLTALVAGTLLTVLGGTDTIQSELFSTNVVKLELMVWARPVIQDFPLFGLGRGAFESVFPAYQTEPTAHVVYSHIENFPLHWAAEWGVPVAAAALLAFCYCLRPSALGAWKSTAAAGATIGLYVFAAQNLLDLGMEIPALPLAFAACAGSLLGDRRSRVRSEDPPPWRWPARTLAVAGAVLACLVLAFGVHDVSEDRDRVRADYEAAPRTPAGSEAVFDELAVMMRRHPADYYFPLVGAAEAWSIRSPRAMAWLERTLERAPINGRAHVLLAEFLVARGARRQALLELRLAARDSPDTTKMAARLAAGVARGFDELMLAVPEGEAGLPTLSQLAGFRSGPDDVHVRDQINLETLARNPAAVAPRVRLSEPRLAALSTDPPSGICADPAPCRAFLAEQATALDRVEPQGSLGEQLRARELVARGALQEADAKLVVACQKPVGRAVCLALRVDVLSRIKGSPELPAAIKAYVAEQCSTTEGCAAAHAWVGQLSAKQGDWMGATLEFSEAATRAPTADAWLRAADAATKAGMHGRAVHALENAAQRRHGDPEIQRRIEAEKAAANPPQLP